MPKRRFSTERSMRAKLQNLNDRADFVAGFDRAFRDGIADQYPTSARPLHSDDLDRGRWIRDPSTGEKIFVRSRETR